MCLATARRMLVRHPQRDNYPHYSFVIMDSKICSVGVNRQHEPDKKFGYHGRRNSKDFRPKLHSEADVLRKYYNRLTTEWDIINIRLSRSGNLALSLPCFVCLNLIRKYNVNEIWYSTNNNFLKLA